MYVVLCGTCFEKLAAWMQLDSEKKEKRRRREKTNKET